MFAGRLRPAVVAALLFAACSNPQKEKARHLERGQAYLAQGNTEAAILEFKNVVQIDPLDARGRYQLALTYLKRDDPSRLAEARDHLAVAVQEDPTNLDARASLVEVCLRLGEAASAATHAESAVRLAPGNPRALLLRGRAYLASGRTDDAIADLSKAAAQGPKTAEPLVYLARGLMAKKEYEQARQHLERAVGLDPKSGAAQIALGDLLVLRSDNENAEKAYRRALELGPDDEAAFLKLSGFLRRSERWEATEAVCRQYVAVKPNDPAAQLALGSFYRERGQLETAQKHLQRARELDPDSAVALDKLLELKLDRGDIGGVRADIQKLVARRADHPLAKYYQARIELTQKNYGEAIRLLRELTQRHPEVGTAQLTLGMALAASGDRPGAVQAFEKATTVKPVAAKAHLALAELHLAQNSPPHLAELEARRAYELNPGHVPTVFAYARALARTSQIPKAVSVLSTAATEHPRDPSLPYGLGLLAREQGNTEEALEHFAQSLVLDPRYETALREMTAIYLEQKKYAEAHKRIEAQLKVAPNPLEYLVLRGQVFEAAGQTQEAEGAYTQAMNSADVASDAYARLATLYLKSKQVDAATRRYETELAKNPKQLGPYVILGILSHVKGDTAQARRHYEAAVELNARAAIASNNLANILADEGKELDRALKLAEASYRERPGDANVVDTLGWVYYQKTSYPQAASLLSTAQRMAPRNPIIAYHYGMALSKLKDRKAEAKKVLQSVLDLGPKFPKADEVNAVLSKL